MVLGLGPTAGEAHCLWTTSKNNFGEGITSASVVGSEKRDSMGFANSKAIFGAAGSVPKWAVFLALNRRDLNNEGRKSPVKAEWSGNKPLSSESSSLSELPPEVRG